MEELQEGDAVDSVDPQRLSLPEDLLLVAVDPYSGALRAGHRVPHAVAGAMLSKLIAEGAFYPPQGGRVYVRSTKPTGDPFLDQLVAELYARKREDGHQRGRDLYHWLRESGIRATQPYMQRLVNRGVLGVQEQVVMRGMFRETVYPLFLPEVAAVAFGRVDQAVRSLYPPDPRGVLLAALAASVRLETYFYPQRSDAPLRRRMAQYVWVFPVTQAVHALVRADEEIERRARQVW